MRERERESVILGNKKLSLNAIKNKLDNHLKPGRQ